MKILDLDRSDFSTIRKWIDPHVFRAFQTPISDDQLERLLTRHENGKLLDLGFKAVTETNGAVGFIHLVLDWRNNLAHVQQVVVGVPTHRRQGIGSAMMCHALQLCFEAHGLHRVQLFVDEGNDGALAFYRRLGFHTDGLMREAIRIEDRYIGFFCMSMLQTEWTEICGQQLGAGDAGLRLLVFPEPRVRRA